MALDKVYDITGVSRGETPTAMRVERVQTRADVMDRLKSNETVFPDPADRSLVVRLYVKGATRFFNALERAEGEFVSWLELHQDPMARKELALYRHRKTQLAQENDDRKMPQAVAQGAVVGVTPPQSPTSPMGRRASLASTRGASP